MCRQAKEAKEGKGRTDGGGATESVKADKGREVNLKWAAAAPNPEFTASLRPAANQPAGACPGSVIAGQTKRG